MATFKQELHPTIIRDIGGISMELTKLCLELMLEKDLALQMIKVSEVDRCADKIKTWSKQLMEQYNNNGKSKEEERTE